MDLFRSTLKPVQKVLEDADMQKKDIDEIVLVNLKLKKLKRKQVTWHMFLTF
jgi:heat shock protein 5